MASEGADQKQELKRLGFLYDYAAVATDLSAKYYELVKKQAPTTLSPGIETLEGAIKSYGAPIVSKVQDIGPKVVSEADKRVDGIVGRANGVYENVTKYTSSENIKVFKKTREEYLKQIETLLEELKTKGFQGSMTDVMALINGMKDTVVKEGIKRVDSANHPMQKTWMILGYDTAWVPPHCGMVPSGLEEDCVFDPRRISVVRRVRVWI